ncbi:MAG TPA: biotin/lipoyl-containing protein [Planctomycetota bacterium]|nr:biotin/lipoyl-containing protein [Planctomycetota bacterium]
MRLFVTIQGRELTVELDGSPAAGLTRVLVDGLEAAVAEAHPGTWGAAEHIGGLEIIVRRGSRELKVAAQGSLTASEGIAGAPRILRLLTGARPATVRIETERDRLRARPRAAAPRGGVWTARSTLPGAIRRLLRSPGERVEDGDPLLTLEAMKMENEVRAEVSGILRTILVREGQIVNAGDRLAEIETM